MTNFFFRLNGLCSIVLIEQIKHSYSIEADNVAGDILKDFREGIIFIGRILLGIIWGWYSKEKENSEINFEKKSILQEINLLEYVSFFSKASGSKVVNIVCLLTF